MLIFRGQVRGTFFVHKNFLRLFNAAVWRFHDAVASDAATRPPSTPDGQEVMPVLREFSELNFLLETPVHGKKDAIFYFLLWIDGNVRTEQENYLIRNACKTVG
jgi:hypothetical protein